MIAGHYRRKQVRMRANSSGSIALDPAAHGEVSTIFSGAGLQHQPDEEPLSKIISLLNDRFGTSWAPQDRVFYDVVADTLAARPDIRQAAAVNTAENFKIVLTRAFVNQVVAQMATSEDMALKIIDVREARYSVALANLEPVTRKTSCLTLSRCRQTRPRRTGIAGPPQLAG